MEEKVPSTTEARMDPPGNRRTPLLHQPPKTQDHRRQCLSREVVQRSRKTSLIQAEPSATVSGVSGYRGYRLDSHGQSDQPIGANLFTARGVQTLQILQPRASPSFASFAKEEPEGEAALQQARSRAQVI